MYVRHDPPVTAVGGIHGTQYPADPDGILDLPDDLARHLLGFPGWTPAPAPVSQEAAPAPVTNTPSAVGEKDLARMKKPDLAVLAEARGLDSSGTVDDLRARLRESPHSPASAEPTPPSADAT